MSADRWSRLAQSLANGGIATEVDVYAYPGGISRSITIRHGDVLIEIGDQWWRKNDSVWIGWQVYTQGVRDGIVRHTWPCTKKRGEVVSAVTEALTS